MAEVTGGDKLASYLEALVDKLGKGGGHVKVGFDDKTYENGMTVNEVAVMNEYGTATAPPRPFFRLFQSENQASWPGDMRKFLKAYNYDRGEALRALGDKMVRELQETIDQYDLGPPLAPETIRKKGHDKQLIDSKLMRNSVIAKVE